jgi:hypothetical protein
VRKICEEKEKTQKGEEKSIYMSRRGSSKRGRRIM